jgi:hypothetical protein
MFQQDPKAFAAFVNKQAEAATKKPSSSMSDERFVKFKRDNTYRFRLLWTTPESDVQREGPFIELYNHGAKPAEGRYRSTVCFTTTLGNRGFDKCPVCKNNTKLWASHEKGNTADKALYDVFKRKFHGYALVYVVNDPVTPENNGQVRVMHYTKGCKDFFASELFGSEGSGMDPIGMDAFKIELGHDFFVSVGEKSGYNHYTYKFATKPSTLDVKIPELSKMVDDIGFDSQDFIKSIPNTEDVEDFYSSVVLGMDEAPAPYQAPSKVDVPQAPRQAPTLESQVSAPVTAPATATAPATELPDDASADESAIADILGSLNL